MLAPTEQIDPCTVMLEITVDENKVSRAFSRVFQEYSRYVNVPGFRPGKAPRAVLERFVDMTRVRQIALERVIEDSYKEAIQEQGITPFRPAKVDTPDLEDNKPYTYKATIPLEPQVSLGEYTGLTIEKPVFTVTDAMVEKEIQKQRDERARMERVTDRGLGNLDVAIGEIHVVQEDGEVLEPGRRQLIYVGSSDVPGYDDAIQGIMPGEERTFTLTYPDSYADAARRGKTATFTVKISSFSARKLPDLDDAFARQVADVETMDALRAHIRERIQQSLQNHADEIAEERLITRILENATVHFPQVLVEDNVAATLQRLENELTRRGMSYEEYLRQQNLTQEQYESGLEIESAQRVKSVLVLGQIARQEELTVSEERLDAEFEQMLNDGKLTEDQYDAFFNDRERRSELAAALVQQALHDFLFSHNTFHEVPEVPEEELSDFAAVDSEDDTE